MTDIRAQLLTICDDPPHDLIEHFQNLKVSDYNNLLTLEQSLKETKSMLWHPVTQSMGLVMLDGDSSTSNRHCYITRGPLRGAILYLTHDDDTRVYYLNLATYLEAERVAFERDDSVEFMRPSQPVMAVNQSTLQTLIEQLLSDEKDEDAVTMLVIYIPSLELQDMRLLERLARHTNFFVPEALGIAILQRPRAELLNVAKILASHPHPQGSGAGRRAVGIINGLRP